MLPTFINTRAVAQIVVGLAGLLAGLATAAQASLLTEFTVRRWAVEDGLPEAAVTGVQQGADGFLWCWTPRHVVRFDGVRFVEAAPPAALASNGVAVLPAGVVWPESRREEQPTAVLADNDGAVWVGTLRGLYRLRGGQWQSLTARDGVVYPVDVRCLALDREGNLWGGTSGGLIRLRPARVQVYRTHLPWGGEVITALLAESPTNFLAAVAGGGLVAGPPEKLQLVHWDGLPETTTISMLLRSRDGTLWVGTQGEGLWRCRAGQRAEPVGAARGVCTLLEDRQGRLWVGTWAGLMQWDRAGRLTFVPGSPDNTVEELYEDSANRIWVGYQSAGLLRIETDGQRRQFSCGSIRALHVDAAGDLWVGTTSGLEWWHGARRVRFTTANGLVDDAILQILEDDAGFLWLGTRHGLMRINKNEFDEVVAGRKVSLAARVFGLEAGMADEQCTGDLGTAAAQTADGRLWFPTMEGIAMVDSRSVPPLPASPPVYLEEVDANGRSVPLPSGVPVRLPLGARDVEFRFTAPLFTAPDRARFRYRLAGYESQWSRSIADRTVRYSRLPAGHYRFRVIARDRDGTWSEPASVTVSVPPFFWETIWFWLAAGLGVSAVVAWSVRRYDRQKTARQLRELERQHAVERERARIARDIHDDIGAGLTEVAMLSELAQVKQPQPGETNKHLDNIFRRARALTQSLDEIVWAINPANDTLECFISYIAEFAQDFLAAAGLKCRLDLPAASPAVPLGAAVRHHLCLAIKEALHNIVKHADASEVHLAVQLNGPTLTVNIHDNGRGYVSTAVGGAASGHDGLTNLQVRLDEIGGQLLQDSQLGQGSRVVLSVELPTTLASSGKTG